MYIDEAGVEEINDKTQYFVTSGAIFHENDLADMKKKVSVFKNDVFTGKFAGNEIHVHDIYKGKREFLGITLKEVDSILTKVYSLINDLNFNTISVAIDKPALIKSKYSNYLVLETAYKFLVERFDKFLRRTDNQGIIRIDRTSNKSNIMNKKDKRILNEINNVRHHGTNWQSVRNIAEEPLFYDSSSRKGLQIADAVVYCTNRHLNNNDFDKYWDLLYPKIQTSPLGNIRGYGLTIFPK